MGIDRQALQHSPPMEKDGHLLDPYRLLYRPQRVGVTNSMLYAYAAMRGNIDKKNRVNDPLHNALYCDPITPPDPSFEKKVYLPGLRQKEDPKLMLDMPRGAFFFYDPSRPAYMKLATSPTGVLGSCIEAQALSYEDFKRKYPPTYRPNHYTGDEGYGNYGYLKINGRWVDPESEGEVFDALTNGPNVPDMPNLPIGIKPGRTMPSNKMYDVFTDVKDELKDGDGDPRALYINPAIFARWAAGATQGDFYMMTKVQPQDLSQQRGRERRPKPPPIRAHPQYDRETGSVFSGDYSPERSPSLVMSAQGVDIVKQPATFARSYPQPALALERAAFGPVDSSQRVEDWLTSSIASTPRIFTEDAAIEDLAGSKELQTGETKWNNQYDSIKQLQEEHYDTLLQSAERYRRRNEAEFEKTRLHKEVYFMEEHLKKQDRQIGFLETPRRTFRRPSAQNNPVVEISPPTPESYALQATPTRGSRLRRRGQFERYFNERMEREMINIRKTCMTNDRLDIDLRNIMVGIEELKQIHEQYLKSLGVESAKDIPNLIPDRKADDKKH